MRIGYYFAASTTSGGVYQYTRTALEALLGVEGNDYLVFNATGEDLTNISTHHISHIINLSKPKHNSPTWLDYLHQSVSLIIQVLLGLSLFLHIDWIVWQYYRYLYKKPISQINNSGVDLMIYPMSSVLSFLTKPKAIVAIHDLQHRLNPQFPEVTKWGIWQIREFNYRSMAIRASMIMAESLIGKKDILNCYPNTPPNKIIVLPYLPPSYLQTKLAQSQVKKIIVKFRLPDQYFYYPAKFWPHKHHTTLIKALIICHDRGYKFGLALTGSTRAEYSTLPAVTNLVRSHHIEQYVKYLGYVSSEEISALYKGSIALVMPTHFGPSNIPVLEAWQLKVPVIYSNVRGCREQLQDAGILADPTNPADWAQAMIKMATDHKFASDCTHKGINKLSNWTEHDFRLKIQRMICNIQ